MQTSPASHYVFILMGVSGSGKSAVANQVSYQLKTAFLDGDFLHPRANIIKMSEGHPLNDEDRRPWLQSINEAAFAMQHTNSLSLIICSALKKRYREILRKDNSNLKFLYMKGSVEVIASRLRLRKSHYFKLQLLNTQFATLEEPMADEPDVLTIDVNHSLQKVVADCIATIKKAVNRS